MYGYSATLMVHLILVVMVPLMVVIVMAGD